MNTKRAMLNGKTWWLTSFIMGLLFPALIVASVFAIPVVNVGLTRFEAIPLDNAVRLEWDTETELETAGFMLKRGQNGSFDYIPDPGGSGDLFIMSQGGPAIGYNYVFTDELVVNDQIYTYQLIEVEIDGTEILHAETTVTVGIVPTNTPIVVAGGGNNGDNGEIATTAETTTVTPTITSSATATTIAMATSPANNTASSSPVPSPTVVRTIAAATAFVDGLQARVNDNDQVSIGSSTFARETNQEAVDLVDSGAAVAFAQDDPQSYPALETIQATPLDSSLDATNEAVEESPAPLEPEVSLEPPRVIGATPYPAEPSPMNPESEAQNTEAEPAGTSLAGRVYLWVAFLASIVIFISAMIGAILLYTRQRSKE